MRRKFEVLLGKFTLCAVLLAGTTFVTCLFTSDYSTVKKVLEYAMDLNKEEVLRLIQQYQKHHLLWDANHKWHFNKSKKIAAWEDIGKALNIDVEDAKKKMSSLLGSFRREKSKGKKRLGTGKEVYKSDWYAFDSFTFLMTKDESREPISSGQISNEMVSSPEPEDTDHNPGCSYTEDSYETAQEEEPKHFRKPSTLKRKRSKHMVLENGQEDPRIQKDFNYVQQPMEQEDCTAMFTKYLTGKLNHFDPRTKSILIHKINELIFEAEMEIYPNHQPASPYSTADVPYEPNSPPSVSEDMDHKSILHHQGKQ